MIYRWYQSRLTPIGGIAHMGALARDLSRSGTLRPCVCRVAEQRNPVCSGWYRRLGVLKKGPVGQRPKLYGILGCYSWYAQDGTKVVEL